jgi:DNA-binding transcriptional LysR family regulator
VFVKHGLALLQTWSRWAASWPTCAAASPRHMRLCASTAAISQFLPPLLARYGAQQPQVRIDLEEQVSEAWCHPARRPLPTRRVRRRAGPGAGRPQRRLLLEAMGQLIAGPFAGQDAGRLRRRWASDQDRAARPAGDPLRKWRLLKDGTSVWWQVQSRNKRSVALDLRNPEAQDIVRRLAAEADVLIENFRPGAMEGWGLGPTRCWS